MSLIVSMAETVLIGETKAGALPTGVIGRDT
jgi:hypothetical protein